MTRPEAIQHDFEAETNLPPAMPCVTIDTTLGRTFSSFEFNFQRFYDLSKDYGISDDEISKLTIAFKNKKDIVAGARYSSNTATIFNVATAATSNFNPSVYTLSENQDSVYSLKNNSKLEPHQKIDILVRHELGHWINQLGPKIGEFSRKLNRATVYSLGALGIVGTLSMPLSTKEPLTALVPIPTSIALIIGFVLARNLTYDFEHSQIPHEIPAYKFESETRAYSLLNIVMREELSEQPFIH